MTTPEEIALANLAEGVAAADEADAARKRRYEMEDAERTRARAEEDRLRAEGIAHCDEVKSALEASLAARMNTPEKQATDQIAELRAEIEALRVSVGVKEPAAVAPENVKSASVVKQPDPVKPVV